MLKRDEIIPATVQQFAREAADQIKGYLPKEHQDVECEVVKEEKNNGVIMTGICFQKAGGTAGVNMYMESCFEDYKQGMPWEEVMKEIASQAGEALAAKSVISAEQGWDFDSVRNSIEPVLVNTKANRRMLGDLPHMQIEDLSVVCRIVLPFREGKGSVKIGNEHLSCWGIGKEQLFTQAFENCRKPGHYVFQTMYSAVRGILEAEYAEKNGMCLPDGGTGLPENILEIPDEKMRGENIRAGFQNEFSKIQTSEIYVLTNQNRYYGASAVLSPEVLEKVDRMFPEGFYILPSSVHECIVIPKTEGTSLKELGDMVREINRKDVRPEEVLSDHIYEYDKERGRIRQATDTMERRKEMER